MARYHINPQTGEVGKCRARRGCPFGGEDSHFSTKEEAARAYEERQKGRTFLETRIPIVPGDIIEGTPEHGAWGPWLGKQMEVRQVTFNRSDVDLYVVNTDDGNLMGGHVALSYSEFAAVKRMSEQNIEVESPWEDRRAVLDKKAHLIAISSQRAQAPVFDAHRKKIWRLYSEGALRDDQPELRNNSTSLDTAQVWQDAAEGKNLSSYSNQTLLLALGDDPNHRSNAAILSTLEDRHSQALANEQAHYEDQWHKAMAPSYQEAHRSSPKISNDIRAASVEEQEVADNFSPIDAVERGLPMGGYTSESLFVAAYELGTDYSPQGQAILGELNGRVSIQQWSEGKI